MKEAVKSVENDAITLMVHLNKDADAQKNIKTIAENLLQNELVKKKMQKFLEHFKFNYFSDALNIATQVFSEHRHHNGRPVRSVAQLRRQKRMQTVRDTILRVFEIEEPSSTATSSPKMCLFFAVSMLISFIGVVGSGIELFFVHKMNSAPFLWAFIFCAVMFIAFAAWYYTLCVQN
uniref:Uncharacterized protein n=1 Tax=Globodera rostochiensis TaxID=31243 RepID=A0A914H7V5_GLORO